MASPVPNQSNVQVALRSFLLSVLPAGTEVIQGQDSRVPEPADVDFVVMTPITRERLATNYTLWADCTFVGFTAGTTLTVTAMTSGTIANGAPLFWTVSPFSGLTIAYATGTGGVGTYTLSGPLTFSGEMAAGQIILTQPTKLCMQLDFHSANVGDSSDMVEVVSTLFRSEVATDSFDASSSGSVWPLYADDPKQIPFQNAEQQYETRWTLDAYLQANQAVPWPQQFTTTAVVTIVEADGAPSLPSGGPSLDFSNADNSQYLGSLIR